MTSLTWTLGEVADVLQVAPLTVRRMWQRGEFPPPIQVARTIRWRHQDVVNWLSSQQPSERYKKEKV